MSSSTCLFCFHLHSGCEFWLTRCLEVFGFELTEEQMGALFALNKNKRYNDPGEFVKGMGGWPHGYPIYD